MLENKVKKAIRKETKHFLGGWGCAQKKNNKIMCSIRISAQAECKPKLMLNNNLILILFKSLNNLSRCIVCKNLGVLKHDS